MLPGCLLDAPVELVQCWLPRSISIRGSRNRVDLSSPLLFPSQMFDSSLWRAALLSCLSPPHTGLLQLISLSSPSAAQRPVAKAACSLGADSLYIHTCYIGSSSGILFVVGQDRTPHWDWSWAWEGSQLRGSLWCPEAPHTRWAVWQLSCAITVHWELLERWRLRSPTCGNALCPLFKTISTGVHSWRSLVSPSSFSICAAHLIMPCF